MSFSVLLQAGYGEVAAVAARRADAAAASAHPAAFQRAQQGRRGGAQTATAGRRGRQLKVKHCTPPKTYTRAHACFAQTHSSHTHVCNISLSLTLSLSLSLSLSLVSSLFSLSLCLGHTHTHTHTHTSCFDALMHRSLCELWATLLTNNVVTSGTLNGSHCCTKPSSWAAWTVLTSYSTLAPMSTPETSTTACSSSTPTVSRSVLPFLNSTSFSQTF